MRQMRHLHRCSFIYKLLELLLVLRLTTPEYDRWRGVWGLEAGGWRRSLWPDLAALRARVVRVGGGRAHRDQLAGEAGRGVAVPPRLACHLQPVRLRAWAEHSVWGVTETGVSHLSVLSSMSTGTCCGVLVLLCRLHRISEDKIRLESLYFTENWTLLWSAPAECWGGIRLKVLLYRGFSVRVWRPGLWYIPHSVYRSGQSSFWLSVL